MAYSLDLADRLDALLARRRSMTRKVMFGGVGYLLHGNMCVGIWKDSLIARVGPDDYAGALRETGVHEFNITGRSMTGWVMVDAEGVGTEADLAAWVERCIAFVRTLPKK